MTKLKYYAYTIDPPFVNADRTVNWALTGNGEFVIGTKGGKRYFIKRNINVLRPVRSTAKALYLQQKKDAEYIEGKQSRLSKAMSGLSEKAGVLAEESNFWDYDNKFVTVTVNCKLNCPTFFR